MVFDQLDKKIMSELDLNAREPATSIAKKIRASKETVNFRINRLVERKYIRLFYTIFNASRIGYLYYMAFITLNGATAENEKKIISYIRNDKICSNLRVCEGPYDLMFTCIVKSPGEFYDFMKRFKAEFGNFILSKEIHSVTNISKINQKFQTSGNTLQLSFSTADTTVDGIDETDIKIMQTLAKDGRTKLVDIANSLGVNPKVVKYRIKRLEKEGIILGYSITPNFDKLGLQFIQINLELKNYSSIPVIMEFFYKTEKCLFIFQLVGKYDLIIELYIENEMALKETMEKFREIFLHQYSHCEIVHVYREYTISWLPF